MADLHILRAHALGHLAARKIAFKWATQAEQEFGMVCHYAQGSTADEVVFSRTGVHGNLFVTEDKFEVKAKLGFLLGAFKDRIEHEILKNLDDLLNAEPPAKAHAPRRSKPL